jgi:dTMP kinase
MSKHPLIAIEGIDGSGKATQSKLLVEEIKSRGRDAVRFEFPNYTNVTGPFVDGHLKRRWEALPLHPSTLSLDDWKVQKNFLNELLFQCLQTLNRYEQVEELQEALKTQAVVLDRFYASSMVYGLVNGLSDRFLRAISSQLPKPDLYILVDIPVGESFNRRPERRDRYEKQKGMLDAVRSCYRDLFIKEGWKIVDGVGTVAEVHARIMDCVPTSFVW